MEFSSLTRGPEFVSGGQLEGGCLLKISGALTMRFNSAVRATRVELQEIPQLNYNLRNMLQPISRRFLRELYEAPRGNNLHYICYSVLASLHQVTRVQTIKVR